MSRCPHCDSPAPHLHPAMQWEGEVQPCAHEYHQQVTPSNTPRYIAEVGQILALTRRETEEPT